MKKLCDVSIDGFAINYDDNFFNKTITLKNKIYQIYDSLNGFERGDFSFFENKTKEKYDKNESKKYIQKLQDCINMNWLTNEIHEKLKNDKCWRVRHTIAQYSDKYHEQLKDDEKYNVRLVIAAYSDKYHEQFKDDSNWQVRLMVASFSNKYDEYLKNDKHKNIQHALKTKEKQNEKRTNII